MKSCRRFLKGCLLIALCVLAAPFSYSSNDVYGADFKFYWDANPPGENITEYRIYWRYSSGTYGPGNMAAVANTATPQFDPDTPEYTLTMTPHYGQDRIILW